MSFTVKEKGFESDTVAKTKAYVQYERIVKVQAYTIDLIVYDELRLSIETSDGFTYQFSEEVEGWEELLSWVKKWASLEDDWQREAYPEPFSKKITTLWCSRQSANNGVGGNEL
jgi:hypothetical protein